MTEAAIQIEGLVKVFSRGRTEVRAVDGLDLEVRRGEVFGLLGPNGAGKTTTVEICEGLQEPTAGRVAVLGRSWGSGADHALRQRMGVTLQDTQMLPKQTVLELVTLFRSFYEDGYAPEEVLAMVELQEKRHARYRQLSGGQKQRLAIACALVGRPELLFLDEPTTGLDPTARRRLWDVVRDFRARGGTVLLTTHYMEEAEQLADRVGIMDHGRAIALGTPAELIAGLGGEHVIQVQGRGLEEVPDAALRALPGVRALRRADGEVALTVEAVHLTLPRLLELVGAERLDGLSTRHASLEDVFLSLTGRSFEESEREEAGAA